MKDAIPVKAVLTSMELGKNRPLTSCEVLCAAMRSFLQGEAPAPPVPSLADLIRFEIQENDARQSRQELFARQIARLL
jgi:hypothetical protein